MDEYEVSADYEDRETCTPERAALTKSTTPSFDAVSLSSIAETYMPKNAAAPFQNDECGDAQLLGEALSDTAGHVKDKVAVLGRSAADKVDEHRDAAASGLDKAASALHDKAESLPGGEKVTSFAHAAADRMTSTADYVREHDVDGMMKDVESLVKNNPGRSLLAAAVIGFLLGRTFSRD